MSKFFEITKFFEVTSEKNDNAITLLRVGAINAIRLEQCEASFNYEITIYFDGHCKFTDYYETHEKALEALACLKEGLE